MDVCFRWIAIALLLAMPRVLGAEEVGEENKQQPPAAVAPVHFSKLVELFPDRVEGWTAEKPEGSSTSAAGFQLSDASRRYTKGESGQLLLRISDAGGNAMFAAAQAALETPLMTETMAGYQKNFVFQGHPAHENYEKESKQGNLTVFVAKRFLVQVNGDGIESAELQAWANRIDLKKLATMK